jgi:hypothetical protein
VSAQQLQLCLSCTSYGCALRASQIVRHAKPVHREQMTESKTSETPDRHPGRHPYVLLCALFCHGDD